MERYHTYSSYLKNKYGEKVYKLPINVETTCPNRDGNVSEGGCTFCGDVATGFEMHDCKISVSEQLTTNMAYIGTKYKAKKYIAYFQNFTNTYMDIENFKALVHESIMPDIVELSISTRPDTINTEILSFLKEVSEENNLEITLELGLQTVNYHNLVEINRGHTLAEYIDAVLRIKSFGFKVCTHIILNLPGDDRLDVVENAKILSALGTDYVKIHSLYILKGTKMGELFKEDKLDIISKDEYIERVLMFLEHLSPDIVVQRLLARAPKEDTLFCNWATSWRKIKDEIDAVMEERDIRQGDRFDYTNGKALRGLKG